MKFYMSCWNYGYHVEEDPFMFDLYHLSAFLIKEHYGEVHLITDYKGEKKFKNLNVFSSIDTRLEEVPKNLGVIWSLGKIYAYKLITEKKEPFIHLDGDVLLFKPLPEDIFSKDVITQHCENYAYKSYHVKDFTESIPNPFYLKKKKIKYAANMGVFGGNNLDFINLYSNEVLKLATDNENQKFFMETNFDPCFGPPCILEQYSMSLLAKIHSVNVDYLFPTEWENDPIAEELGFCHIWGAKYHKRKELQEKIKLLKYRYELSYYL